jgi:hypothetical protein
MTFVFTVPCLEELLAGGINGISGDFLGFELFSVETMFIDPKPREYKTWKCRPVDSLIG